MSKLAQLTIDLTKQNKELMNLLANAGNQNKEAIFNKACELHITTSQMAIEADRLVVPELTALLDNAISTGEISKMLEITDRHCEKGL